MRWQILLHIAIMLYTLGIKYAETRTIFELIPSVASTGPRATSSLIPEEEKHTLISSKEKRREKLRRLRRMFREKLRNKIKWKDIEILFISVIINGSSIPLYFINPKIKNILDYKESQSPELGTAWFKWIFRQKNKLFLINHSGQRFWPPSSPLKICPNIHRTKKLVLAQTSPP